MHQKKKTAIIIFITALVFAFVLLFFLTPSKNSSEAQTSNVVVPENVPATTTTTTTTSVQSVTTPPPADIPKYKDGTYTATGSYDSPAGIESVNVSVTLSDDIVVSSSVTPLAEDGRSMGYQEMFIDAYKQYVVGKSLDSIHLDVVSGSSLTPKGFNDALITIKSEALAS